MITLSRLWAKLRNRKYRKAFVANQLKRGVPFQIRAMRKKAGWSQQELAEKSGLSQGVISRAEDLDYGNLTFNTVLEIANGFDVAFVGKFVRFSELAKWFENLSEESVQVLTFDEEEEAIAGNQALPRATATTGVAKQHLYADPFIYQRILGLALGRQWNLKASPFLRGERSQQERQTS